MPCMKCVADGRDLGLYLADLQDNGLYHLECDKGHATTVAIQEQPFELLYELGVNAICDHYYREAITAFTAALERFYEFFVQVSCIRQKISEAQYKECWKEVSKQSERQLGAFIFTYLREMGDRPPLLSNDLTSFRNNVVHRGKIPSPEEAITFGKAVLTIIQPTLKEMKEKWGNEVREAVSRHVRDNNISITPNPSHSSLSYPSTINITRHVAEPDPTLEEALQRIANHRRRWEC